MTPNHQQQIIALSLLVGSLCALYLFTTPRHKNTKEPYSTSIKALHTSDADKTKKINPQEPISAPVTESRNENAPSPNEKAVSPSGRNTIEISLSDVESVREAIKAGATCLELSSNRNEGGVTPSIGLVEQVVDLLKGLEVLLHVVIRPRPGGFVYTDCEFATCLRDIAAAKYAGADGIVIGVLTPDGKIDVDRMKQVRSAAKNMIVTFNRSFDICRPIITTAGDKMGWGQDIEYLPIALEEIISVGCDRLLTSGRASTALEGSATLKRLVSLSAGRIEVVAAAGISASNVMELVAESGVKAVHAGSAVTVTHATPPYQNENCREITSTMSKCVPHSISSKSSDNNGSTDLDSDPDDVERHYSPTSAFSPLGLTTWDGVSSSLVYELSDLADSVMGIF